MCIDQLHCVILDYGPCGEGRQLIVLLCSRLYMYMHSFEALQELVIHVLPVWYSLACTGYVMKPRGLWDLEPS